MKAKKTYLKGNSVFIVSLVVIGITVLTIYFSGVHYHRSVTENFYWSLTIISCSLLTFLTLGLYLGVGVIDNFPAFKKYKRGNYMPPLEHIPNFELPDLDLGDGISEIAVSILLWIVMAFLLIFSLVILEFVFWISTFIILAMLYWLYFRALRLVFNKSAQTKGKLDLAFYYGLVYTLLYTGWLFLIVLIAERFR